MSLWRKKIEQEKCNTKYVGPPKTTFFRVSSNKDSTFDLSKGQSKQNKTNRNGI